MHNEKAWRTLYELHEDVNIPAVRDHWPEEDIDFLEDQGCITVQKSDGKIQITSSGFAQIKLMDSFSKGNPLERELNPRFIPE